jgi:hypothetical protein
MPSRLLGTKIWASTWLRDAPTGARDRTAGLPFRQALLGFNLLVLGKLGLSTELGTALALALGQR